MIDLIIATEHYALKHVYAYTHTYTQQTHNTHARTPNTHTRTPNTHTQPHTHTLTYSQTHTHAPMHNTLDLVDKSRQGD